MTEKLTVITERVDDIPVLTASAERMGLAELLDEYFVAHGNWQGISPGKMFTGWLAHILSEADHRMNQVQDWAAKRIETLQGCLRDEVNDLDFSDDRLSIGLDMLSDDERWVAFESALNQRTIRVYKLQAECVRIDTTTASGYWQVTKDGLFQLGYSKDHRPDQPQLKVVLATLDPLGMPTATQVVSGEKADDPLYIPAIDQVREGLDRCGLLYVGDCKMMSIKTRAHLAAGDDYYLGPFSQVQVPEECLDSYLKPVWRDEQPLEQVERQVAGTIKTIAEGFERSETLTANVNGKEICWEERQLVVRSLAHAKNAEAALHHRLEQAQTAIETLPERKQGKVPFTAVETLRQAAQSLLKKHQAEILLQFDIAVKVPKRHVRKYGDRPAETRVERQLEISVQRNEIAIQQAIRRLGWRVYGTNSPQSEHSLEQAVLAYRNEYIVEHGFGRLKGKPLSLTPMYLQDDPRATGLTRLLSIGLRVLTLLEHTGRSHLAETGEKLSGLYAGNPPRATNRPTTESMLRAFKDIFLSRVTVGDKSYRHLTPLSVLQTKILHLLDLPITIYTELAGDFKKPP